MHIRKGDSVKATAGKDKGKEGRVTVIESRKDRAVVEGVNVIKKYQRPTQLDPKGEILETKAAVHVSNIQLLDPKTNEPTCVGCKFVDGKKVRITKRSGEEIKPNN